MITGRGREEGGGREGGGAELALRKLPLLRQLEAGGGGGLQSPGFLQLALGAVPHPARHVPHPSSLPPPLAWQCRMWTQGFGVGSSYGIGVRCQAQGPLCKELPTCQGKSYTTGLQSLLSKTGKTPFFFSSEVSTTIVIFL